MHNIEKKREVEINRDWAKKSHEERERKGKLEDVGTKKKEQKKVKATKN